MLIHNKIACYSSKYYYPNNYEDIYKTFLMHMFYYTKKPPLWRLFGYYSKGLPSPKLIIIFEDTSYIGIMKEKLNEIRKIGV